MSEKDQSLFGSIIARSAAGVDQDIKEGANLNARDLAHNTPLHCAAGQPLIVRRLLDHGADPNAINADGWTPLHLSVGSPETNRFARMEVMRDLLEAGANPNISSFEGDTPLHNAASIPRETATPVSQLLQAGAHPMARDRLGNTPLHYAAGHRAQYRGQAVLYLLEAGADPNAQNRYGNTPLHMAIRGAGEDQTKALAYLLRSGADLSIPNSRGQTPLQLSAEQGNPVAQNTIKREAAGRHRMTQEASASTQPQQQEAQQMAKNNSPQKGNGRANEYYKQFADRIIEQMEKGVAPWQKPWKPGQQVVPQSLSTGREYRGGNSLHLMSVAQEKGYSDPRWGTFDHIKYAGGAVRKGEKGTPVVWWDFSHTKRKVAVTDRDGKPVHDDKGKPIERFQAPTCKVYTVFNVEQTKDLKEKLPPVGDQKPSWDPHRLVNAEDLITASKVKIRHVGGDRAYYSLKADAVTLPKRSQFPNATAYYHTANHELAHATGHPSRMDRDSLKQGVSEGFGSEPYAREELRAEISAMMTNTRLGLGHESKEGAAYVAAWSETLKKNPREIYFASRDAQTISDYLVEPVRERLRTEEKTQPKEQARPAEKQPGQTKAPVPEAAKEKTPAPTPAAVKSAKAKSRSSKPSPQAKPKTRRTKPPAPDKARAPKRNGNSLANRMKTYRDTIPKDHVELKAERTNELPGGHVTYKYGRHTLPSNLEGLTKKEFGAKHIVAHAPLPNIQNHVRTVAQRQAERAAGLEPSR